MAALSLLPAFASKYGLGSSYTRSGPAGEPAAAEEDEETQCVVSHVTLLLGDGSEAGVGSLYVTTRRVIWSSASAPAAPAQGDESPEGKALVLRYQQIVMHAISRDGTASSRPCLYLQLDDGSEDMEEGEEEGEGQEGGLEPEVRLLPQDEAQVQDIFKALCDCAALNPDAEEEAEGEGEFFFDEDEVLRGLDDEERAALLARQAGDMELADGREELGELVGEDPGRFEDDEEEEQEDEEVQGAQQQQRPRPHGNGNI